MKFIPYGILGVIVLGISLFFIFSPDSHDSMSTKEVDSPFSISSEAPFSVLWRTGAAYAVVSGNLDGTGRIEIVGNLGRDREDFIIGPGPVELGYGGPEMWIRDFHLTYTPITASSGELYASIYCGFNMAQTDRELYHEAKQKK